MDLPASAFPGAILNRRQFGLVVGGGAFLLVAGGTYGVIARSEPSGITSVRTDFGKVSVIRAGRFARLDAQGHTAASNFMTAASRFSGWGTESFQRVRGSDVAAISGGHGHGDAPQNPAWRQPVNLTWGDVLVLEAEISNESPQPVLFSPAQLRLKLTPSGTTVTPKDSDRVPGVLAANDRERILISYLAPPSITDLELEFSDVAQANHRRLALPTVTTVQAFS